MEEWDFPVLLSGRYFTAQDIRDIQYTVSMFTQLSRYELTKTICENLDWLTPNGEYKIASCQQVLEKLEGQGFFTLPAKQELKIKDTGEKIEFGLSTEPDDLLEGTVRDIIPINLEPVRITKDIRLWNEYVHRYHSLGYKRPFGAHQRYFIKSGVIDKPLGCLLFGAAAWALSSRDEWIGWTKTDRSLRLNLVLNNNRFLLFPWVRVKNLASKVLSLVVKQIGDDWQKRYGYSPVLLETFVDPEKYRGTSYQAANWVYLGQTKGRGRMDRYTKKQFSCKDIYVYPLASDFRNRLKGGEVK